MVKTSEPIYFPRRYIVKTVNSSTNTFTVRVAPAPYRISNTTTMVEFLPDGTMEIGP